MQKAAEEDPVVQLRPRYEAEKALFTKLVDEQKKGHDGDIVARQFVPPQRD